MDQDPMFQIIYSEEVVEFLKGLGEKAKSKIMYNINRCKYVMSKDLFKKLQNTDIWEFRTLYAGVHYRIFAFWDKSIETLVITTHAIVKKTQKTPQKEIEKAERIMKDYFKNK
jgi:phage-related protein